MLYIGGDIRVLYVPGEMMYLFVYVPVAVVTRLPPLGIESDLCHCIQIEKEVQFEPAVVTESVADPPFSTLSPRSG